MIMNSDRKNQIIDRAKAFSTIKEFRSSFPADYLYASRHGFSEEAFGHMRRIRVTQDRYGDGRHCTKCLQHKDMSAFYRMGNKRTGMRPVCKECCNKSSEEWRKNNIEKARAIVSKSAKNNPETGKRMKRNARKRHPEAFAARYILKRVLKLSGKRKTTKAEESLGYTFLELRSHIEGQFKDGMTWDNWGEWHIDHIKPVATFVREGVTCPRKINALDNLRPLWAIENLSRPKP